MTSLTSSALKRHYQENKGKAIDYKKIFVKDTHLIKDFYPKDTKNS